MAINPYDLQRIQRSVPGGRPIPLQEGAKHEVGRTYYCGYWRQTYTVEAVHHNVPVWGWTVTCRWDDGRTNTHSTPLDPRRDYLIET